MSDSAIDPKWRALMNDIARDLDIAFNGHIQGPAKETGFVLLLFPFNGPKGQRCNYISNAERRDIVSTLKEIVARFEGQPEHKPGHA